MEAKRALLKEAITKADVTAVTTLVTSLNSQSYRALLDDDKDEENLIELALRLGNREIAIRILISNTNISYEDFTWLKLFSMTEKEKYGFANLLSAPKATSSQIIERLKYASPLISRDDFPLETIAHKPKYLKAAFALGATCTNATVVACAIINSALYYDYKIELLNWLVDNKHVTKQPLPPYDLFHLIRQSEEKSCSIDPYLKKFPDWFLDEDSDGNNILYYGTKLGGVRVSTLNRIMRLIRKHCNDSQKIIAAASHKNKKGLIPAVSYLTKYLTEVAYPKEFVLALKNLLQKDEMDPTFKKYIDESLTKDVSNVQYAMLYFYLVQHGQPQHTQQLRSYLQNFTQCQDFHQLFHCIEKPKPEEETKTANISIKGNDTHDTSFLDLPTELQDEIIMQLAPDDLVRLYTCSKTQQEQFKMMFNQNETYWRQYHQKHYSQIEEIQTPYRTRVQQLLKSCSGWRQNKYSTIAELKGNPLLMDENWLILREHRSVFYWNCHTQKLVDASVMTYSSSDAFIGILGNSTKLPKLLVGRWRNWDGYRLEVLSESGTYELRDLPQSRSNNSFEEISLINHSTLFFSIASERCIYDIEQEKVTRKLFLRHGSNSISFNPFNNTFITLPAYATDQYAITDLRTNNTVWVPQVSKQPMIISYAKAVDEHTLFIGGCYPTRAHPLGSAYTSANGFIDLRTGSEINIVKNIIPMCYNTKSVVASNERLFVHSLTSPLISSWHLPSRKIEWIQPTKDIPKKANSRYLVSSDTTGTNAYVRDYTAW